MRNVKSNTGNIPHLGLVTLLIASCINPAPVPLPIFTGTLYYKTQNGADLLNPQTQGHFNKDEINVSNLVLKNGVVKEIPADLDTNSCGTYVCQSSGTGYYHVYLQAEYEYKGTLIHISSTSVDTLTYETVPMNSGNRVTKILYKGQVIWSPAPTGTTYNTMTIVK